MRGRRDRAPARAHQRRERGDAGVDESPSPGARPAQRHAELELDGVGTLAEASQAADERARIVAVARREQLDEILASARGIAGTGRRRDAVRRAGPHQPGHRGGRERGRHGGRTTHDRAAGAAEAQVDGGLDHVPAVDGEYGRATVARDGRVEQVGEALEEGGRAVVRGAEAVQVDVVAIERGVDHGGRIRHGGELFGERRRVQVVHLERHAAPRTPVVVAPTPVRRHQDERARARDDDRRRCCHRSLLSPGSDGVYRRWRLTARIAGSTVRTRPGRPRRDRTRVATSRPGAASGRPPPRRCSAATAVRSRAAG